MPAGPETWRQDVERDGFAVVPAVFASQELDALVRDLTAALAEPSESTAVRSREGHVYAARNVLRLWPPAASIWRRPPFPRLLSQILGTDFGLVRVLFFDKPPEQTWTLPWHKDMTIAVREHRGPSQHFRKPTRKAGVPHLEAPQELLEAMLTLRIHLDNVTEANGPMKVIPGSHTTGKTLQVDESLRRSILACRGDALLIRPLVAHSSAASHPGNLCHRRVLHLEFAGWPSLPDGAAWHDFIPFRQASIEG